MDESLSPSATIDMPDPLPELTPYGGRPVAPVGASAKLNEVAKKALRAYGTATAAVRPGPDFLVVGTKRGGTTSMFNYLLAHPQVLPLFPPPEKRKGAYFFDVNVTQGRSESWYRSHFPSVAARTVRDRMAGASHIVGEATPYYLYHPHAPRRAQAMLPNAKIVMLLRNPVDRAYSHWKERSRQGVEYLDFEDAIAAEAGRLAGEIERLEAVPSYYSFAHQHYSYVDQGRYSAGVRRWLEAYDSSQVLILRSEDFYAEPAKTLARTQEFLGIDTFDPGGYKKWNFHQAPEMNPDQLSRLADLVRDDVAELEALLHRDFQWDL